MRHSSDPVLKSPGTVPILWSLRSKMGSVPLSWADSGPVLVKTGGSWRVLQIQVGNQSSKPMASVDVNKLIRIKQGQTQVAPGPLGKLDGRRVTISLADRINLSTTA